MGCFPCKNAIIRIKVSTTSGETKRFIATGSARNSAVFTKAAPVLSFATDGAIGMYHNIGDGIIVLTNIPKIFVKKKQSGNGASTSFFWTRWDPNLSIPKRAALSVTKRLDRKFSLFAYIVEGQDVLERSLRSGQCVVKSIDVLDGPWSISKAQ